MPMVTAKNYSILAIDHGEVRVGLAFKPPTQDVAVPLDVIDGQPVEAAMSRIRRIIAEREVNLVVVGLPVHSDESQGKRVRRFTRRLRRGVQGVMWRFVDESLTSEAAESDARQAGKRRRGKPIDDGAALLILKTYLQAQN